MADVIAQKDHSGPFNLEESHEKFTDAPEEETVKSSLPPQGPVIDIENHRYPYCIVWTALPVITAVVPNIGHTGICTSEGVIHDFAASHYISVDNFAFGDPQKYVVLDPEGIDPKEWDACVVKADNKFRRTRHNLFTNNCHSHVADVLNAIKYRGKTTWGMMDVWWLIIKEGKSVK